MQNYFNDIETFSACYAFEIGLLDSCGRNFKVPTINELVKFDGFVIHDGMIGGSDGAFYCRWKFNRSDFDEEISNRINLGIWLQIKRVIKFSITRMHQKAVTQTMTQIISLISSTRLLSITSMSSKNGMT